MGTVVVERGDILFVLYDDTKYTFTRRNEHYVRRSVVRGVLQQHRLRYLVELKLEESLIQILNREVRSLLPRILEDLGATKFFPLFSWPTVGVAVVEVFGVEFPLEVYVCYPISHPTSSDQLRILLPVEYREFAVCVEPVAPLKEWIDGWRTIRIPTLKSLGRVSLSASGTTWVLVVKRMGLYYVSTCKACSDVLGGLSLSCPTLSCRDYRRGEVVETTRRLLSKGRRGR